MEFSDFGSITILMNIRQTPGESVQKKFPGIFLRLLDESGTTGNLTTDAYLGALVIEHQAELHSNDSDFSRFKGLRWRNPLKA